MTDFDEEKFMIQVKILVAQKVLVHDNQMVKCDVTVR